MAFWRHEPDPWPDRTWRPAPDGRLLPRRTVLVAGEDDLAVAVLRRSVRSDDVVVAGPPSSFEHVVEDVDELRPDLVVLCGTTDDPRLHAAMYELHATHGPTSLALILRLGRSTRCLPMEGMDPDLDALVLELAG